MHLDAPQCHTWPKPGYDAIQIKTQWLSVVARIAITVAVLWYLLRIVPFAAVFERLAAATPILVLAGISVQIVLRMLNALRIRTIARAQGAPLSYRAILAVLFTSSFYALMLPGSLAAGAATLVKYVGHGVTPAAALASMIVNRLVDTMTVISVGFFWWGIEHRVSDNTTVGSGAEVLVVLAPLALIGFHVMLFGRARVLSRVANLTRSHHLEKGRLYRTFVSVIEQCAQAGNLSRRAASMVGVQSVLQDLLASLGAYCFAHAVGVDLSFVTIAWMRAAVSLLIMLPISFSGIGIRESALVFMTKAYGVAASVALAWSLLQFSGLLSIALIGAFIEARSLWRRSSRMGL